MVAHKHKVNDIVYWLSDEQTKTPLAYRIVMLRARLHEGVQMPYYEIVGTGENGGFTPDDWAPEEDIHIARFKNGDRVQLTNLPGLSLMARVVEVWLSRDNGMVYDINVQGGKVWGMREDTLKK